MLLTITPIGFIMHQCQSQCSSMMQSPLGPLLCPLLRLCQSEHRTQHKSFCRYGQFPFSYALWTAMTAHIVILAYGHQWWLASQSLMLPLLLHAIRYLNGHFKINDLANAVQWWRCVQRFELFGSKVSVESKVEVFILLVHCSEDYILD